MATIAQILVAQNPDKYSEFCERISAEAQKKAKTLPTPPAFPATSTDFLLNAERMTLVFPLNPNRDLAGPIRERGKKKRFGEKKNNLQFTVIGFPTGRLIANAVTALDDGQWNSLLDKIEELIRQTCWNWSVLTDEEGQPQYWELKRNYPEVVNRKDGKGQYTRQNPRWSVTLLINLPSLIDFYDELEELVNDALTAVSVNLISLPWPVPHITLLVKGRCRDGIRIASAEELEECKLRRW